MGNSYQSPSNGAYLQIFRYSLKDAEKVTIRLLFDSTTKATLPSGFLVALCARDSGGIRTHDPQLRRLLLYPTELRNHPYCTFLQMLRKSNIFFPITLHLIDNFSHKVE